jgi:two-component system, OmpR family, response regulator VanR
MLSFLPSFNNPTEHIGMVHDILAFKAKSVLFAEDDSIARAQIADILQMLFGELHVAVDGEEALRLYEEEMPDILLTDIKMPKRDGISLIRRIRKEDYNLPIVLMTSFTERDLLIDAANLSIDGYLVKPVDLATLTSALSRAFQRTLQYNELIELDDGLYYNSATKVLYRNGQPIDLGTKEQELLKLLLSHRNSTVTREEISRALWPLDPICGSAIKNIILRLRKKLESDIIVSVRGIGYYIHTPDTPA